MKKIYALILPLVATACSAFAQSPTTLTIRIENVVKVEGQVLVGLFNNADGFPEDREQMVDYKIAKVTEEVIVVEFSGLAPGNYAFSVVQDYNENYKMDKTFFGLPKEPYAFSNNYVPKISAPDFYDCSFKLSSGSQSKTVQLLH